MHSPSVGENGEPAQSGHKQLGTEAYYSVCIYMGDLLNMGFTSISLYGVGGEMKEERKLLIGCEALTNTKGIMC